LQTGLIRDPGMREAEADLQWVCCWLRPEASGLCFHGFLKAQSEKPKPSGDRREDADCLDGWRASLGQGEKRLRGEGDPGPMNLSKTTVIAEDILVPT